MTVMLLLSLLFFLLPDWPGRQEMITMTDEDSAWVMQWRAALTADTVETGARREARAFVSVPGENRSKAKGELFPFDPNMLDSAGWRRLGLREKTVRTILNYRTRGGLFRSPEDLSRIYGLFPDEYERMRPYIRINSPEKKNPAYVKDKSIHHISPQRVFPLVVVNINSADSADWEALPGIDPRLAQRIIRYREALGGFSHTDQVAETYGLQDSVFRKIKDRLVWESADLRWIPINRASFEELSAHPYISPSLARRLLAYREVHGAFQTLEDLRKIAGLDDNLLSRLEPYLNFVLK